MSERAQALEAATRKIRAHTSYNPAAGRAFLAELLASVERIADAALAALPIGVSPQPDEAEPCQFTMGGQWCVVHHGYARNCRNSPPSLAPVEPQGENWFQRQARLAARDVQQLPPWLRSHPPAVSGEGETILRIEVFRDDDGRFAAEFRSGDNKVGGMGEYSATPVGALANMCATLIKIDEDESIERRESPR